MTFTSVQEARGRDSHVCYCKALTDNASACKHALLSSANTHFSDCGTQALGEFSAAEDSVQAAHFGSSVTEWYLEHHYETQHIDITPGISHI